MRRFKFIAAFLAAALIMAALSGCGRKEAAGTPGGAAFGEGTSAIEEAAESEKEKSVSGKENSASAEENPASAKGEESPENAAIVESEKSEGDSKHDGDAKSEDGSNASGNETPDDGSNASESVKTAENKKSSETKKSVETTKSSETEKASGASQGEASGTLRNTARITITEDSFRYSGSTFGICYSGTNCTASGTLTAAEIGTYTAVFTPVKGYAWENGSAEAKSFTWKIEKGLVPKPVIESTNVVATLQTCPSLSFTYYPSLISADGTWAQSAGTYTAVFSLKDPAHYTWEDGSSANYNVVWTASYDTSSPNISTGAMAAELNQDRANNGRASLSEDAFLMQIAAIRAQEIVSDFSHDHLSAYSELIFSNSFWIYGENIAKSSGNPDAAKIETQWRNSPGHWENILKEEFTHYGVAYYISPTDGLTYAVQIFGGK